MHALLFLTHFLFQAIQEIEQTILLSDTSIPVYIVNWTPEINNLMAELADSKIIDENASSAAKGVKHEIFKL